jgi:hypothetical protein
MHGIDFALMFRQWNNITNYSKHVLNAAAVHTNPALVKLVLVRLHYKK